MKMQVMMKDPDTLLDALEDEARKLTKQLIAEHGLTEDGAKAEAEARVGKAAKLARRYFNYDEYLTVELDTDANTITVVPVNG